MKYNYVTLYNKSAAFYNARPKRKRALLLFNDYATFFFIAAYLFAWGFGFFQNAFTPRDFVSLFFFPAFTLLAVSALRLGVARPRPYEKEGAGITPLKKKDSQGNSFPSRHLTCAAVITTVLLPYFPAVGVLLALLCLGLGYARFAIGWHYPSDLVIGLILGVVGGCGVFIV